ncbi:uncharacterized protein F4807DRAFT_467261 [Annulohypoxylon truncatum]|uniref:uncharacterized protein n=1 Tax=Annulohypoxylon truncatum TaxID=327061 RepID=UPI0020072075|nr:uncharacterized protein F4807DRAFT_467261 [Annulohypoxylon truncatum]KAI1210124.1 hypothetical protein F4807DRAFT_467261 [Annulohypoxylon truncatum]
MANESISPYPEGSAEFTATYLTTRALGCSHPVKYHADHTKEHSKYPSRLGFFHVTAKEPRISFLDTGRLCNACLDAVVPDGFHFWSAYSIINGTSATDSRAPQPRWLDMAPSSLYYPPLTQAGIERFPHVSSSLEVIPPHLNLSRGDLPIPKVPGAKEAWEWLQKERKPFYIDQLHLIKGWSLIVERRAKTDSIIAERAGTAYHPEAQPKAQGRKRKPLGKETASFEEELGNPAVASPKAKGKNKAAEDRQSTLPRTTESNGNIAKPSVVALDEPDAVSKFLNIHQREENISPALSTSPREGNDATSIKSIKKTTKKSSTAVKRDKEPIKPKSAEQVVGNATPNKTVRFTFTKNWNNHDPIPFDSPIIPPNLSHYERQAQIITPIKDPESNFSLEKLMGKKKSTTDKISFSGPGSSTGTPGIMAFLRADEAEAGESKKPAQVPDLVEKMIHEALARHSLTTNTREIENKRGIPLDSKSCKQPIADGSSKPTKPSTEKSTSKPAKPFVKKSPSKPNKPFVEKPSTKNESIHKKSTKEPTSSGEQHEEDASWLPKLTECGRGVGKPTKNKPQVDMRSGLKPQATAITPPKVKLPRVKPPKVKSSEVKPPKVKPPKIKPPHSESSHSWRKHILATGSKPPKPNTATSSPPNHHPTTSNSPEFIESTGPNPPGSTKPTKSDVPGSTEPGPPGSSEPSLPGSTESNIPGATEPKPPESIKFKPSESIESKHREATESKPPKFSINALHEAESQQAGPSQFTNVELAPSGGGGDDDVGSVSDPIDDTDASGQESDFENEGSSTDGNESESEIGNESESGSSKEYDSDEGSEDDELPTDEDGNGLQSGSEYDGSENSEFEELLTDEDDNSLQSGSEYDSGEELEDEELPTEGDDNEVESGNEYDSGEDPEDEVNEDDTDHDSNSDDTSDRSDDDHETDDNSNEKSSGSDEDGSNHSEEEENGDSSEGNEDDNSESDKDDSSDSEKEESDDDDNNEPSDDEHDHWDYHNESD